jgi:hypothetical protein
VKGNEALSADRPNRRADWDVQAMIEQTLATFGGDILSRYIRQE